MTLTRRLRPPLIWLASLLLALGETGPWGEDRTSLGSWEATSSARAPLSKLASSKVTCAGGSSSYPATEAPFWGSPWAPPHSQHPWRWASPLAFKTAICMWAGTYPDRLPFCTSPLGD